MKKITVLALTISLLAGYSVWAQENGTNKSEEILISVEEQEITLANDKRTVMGKVESVSDEQIALTDFVLNINEDTLVLDHDLVPTQIKEGDIVTAVASTMETRSIPPQSYAFYIIVHKDEETPAPIYMTVDRVEDGFIYSEDGNYEVTFENAEVSMYKTKNIVKAEELTKGSEIFVYADTLTMSIPALANPTKIVIKNIAQTQNTSKAELLNEQGILLGTDKGLELDRNVTRAEAVALIQRTSPVAKMVYNSNFEDVPNTHWAYSSISWATETNIVNGVGENKFEPDRTVTAKELTKMLLNAQGEDVKFEDAFEAASNSGFVTEDDNIQENDELSREDTAKIIYNYLNNEDL